MLRRLEYVSFIACIILLAVLAPVLLFAVRDRISNQTLYAENQELTVSGILTNNYIEYDAVRYTTYLYNKSLGVEYEVTELDSTLGDGEILELLSAAFVYDSLDFDMFSKNVTTVSNTQYAVYNAEDHTDIIFLLTLITIEMNTGYRVVTDSGHEVSWDMARILVDLQTGMLYFMGLYYIADHFAAYDGLFSDSALAAAVTYSEMMRDRIPDMTEYTYLDLVLSEFAYFKDVLEKNISYAEYYSSMGYVDVDGFFDLTSEDGFFTGVQLDPGQSMVSFPICFAAFTPDRSTCVPVELTTQFNTYEVGDFADYQCNLCIGIREFARLIPEFNYRSPSVG